MRCKSTTEKFFQKLQNFVPKSNDASSRPPTGNENGSNASRPASFPAAAEAPTSIAAAEVPTSMSGLDGTEGDEDGDEDAGDVDERRRFRREFFRRFDAVGASGVVAALSKSSSLASGYVGASAAQDLRCVQLNCYTHWRQMRYHHATYTTGGGLSQLDSIMDLRLGTSDPIPQ